MSSRFIKNSGILLSGNALAQGLAFAAYLILLRLFTPDDFGLCNVFFSYTEVLIILSTCKYEMAVVVASDDKEASTLARLAFRLNRGVSLLLLGVVTIMTLCGVTVSKLPAAFPHPRAGLFHRNQQGVCLSLQPQQGIQTDGGRRSGVG